MSTLTQRNLKKAERSYEIVCLKARIMTYAWMFSALLIAAVTLLALTVDVGAFAMMILPFGMIGAQAYFSFSDDQGVYIQRRKARWELQDAKEEYVEEVVLDAGL